MEVLSSDDGMNIYSKNMQKGWASLFTSFFPIWLNMKRGPDLWTRGVARGVKFCWIQTGASRLRFFFLMCLCGDVRKGRRLAVMISSLDVVNGMSLFGE